jgi:transcriptional regulator with XRE-family HTH domain
MGSPSRSDSTLFQVRKALGLTQIEAAEILGITQAAVSKQEQKQGKIASIVKLVEAKGFQAQIVIGNNEYSIPLNNL